MENWKTFVTFELNQAVRARNEGNEGRARVCSRRAVGIAIGEFYNRLDFQIPGQNAIKRINLFLSHEGISDRSREIAQNMLLKVSEEYKLPADIDLIAEAIILIEEILGEPIEI